MSALSGASIRDAGEAAISVELGERIDPGVHERVLALDAAITAAGVIGVRETVPSYRALLVIYDPRDVTREDLLARLDALSPETAVPAPRAWSVPACFAGDHADDIGTITAQTGLSAVDVIAALTGAPLRLYMYGFAPGFAYLGGLDPRLSIPRRATPRNTIPPASVMIARGQASIASVSMPTGWYVAGRTPVQMFSPERDPMVPFGLGDTIWLREISDKDFDALSARAASGAPVVEQIHGDAP